MNAEAVPASISSWRGRRVALRDETGAQAMATIGGLSLIRGLYPFTSTRDSWDGLEGGPPMENGQVAREAWGVAADGVMAYRQQDGVLLIAALEGLPQAREFERARWLWAVPEGSSPIVYTRSTSERDVPEAALVDRFRRLPVYRELQLGFEGQLQGTGNWDESAGGAQVVAWRAGGSQRQFYSVRASTGQAFACGDEFYGSLWALFESSGGALVPILSLHLEPNEDPPALLDLDSDGRVEVLVRPTRLLVPQPDGSYRVADDLQWPDYNGGC